MVYLNMESNLVTHVQTTIMNESACLQLLTRLGIPSTQNFLNNLVTFPCLITINKLKH